MEETIEHKAEMIQEGNVKNIELISYFKGSTIKSPIYLGVIQKKYAEIKPLIDHGLINDLDPVKSYVFNLDKLENSFYKKFQEKIDNLSPRFGKERMRKPIL